jgi:hypothetical protein
MRLSLLLFSLTALGVYPANPSAAQQAQKTLVKPAPIAAPASASGSAAARGGTLGGPVTKPLGINGTTILPKKR